MKAGSPPHTRGKPPTSPIYGFTNRLTPAHAGKTFHRFCHRSFHQAHPRTRGENAGALIPSGTVAGSPPHTRGKRSSLIRSTASCKAHPRTRGENGMQQLLFPPQTGSPPHTRGKQNGQKDWELHLRLTPAHAGKTKTQVYKGCTRQAHPRTRGENVIGNLWDNPELGSPPHTRGKLIHIFFPGE